MLRREPGARAPDATHRRQLRERRRCVASRSEEHTSELQSRQYLVCRLLLEKKKSEAVIALSKKADYVGGFLEVTRSDLPSRVHVPAPRVVVGPLLRSHLRVYSPKMLLGLGA